MGCMHMGHMHPLYISQNIPKGTHFQWDSHGAHREVPWVDPGEKHDASSCSGLCGRYRIPTTTAVGRTRVLVQARFLTSKGWPFTQTPALTRCNLIFCKYLNISLSFFELDS